MNRSEKHPLGPNLDELEQVQKEINNAFPAYDDNGELAQQMDLAKKGGNKSAEAGTIGTLPKDEAAQIAEFQQQIASVPDTADDGELQRAMDTASVNTDISIAEQTPSMSPLPKPPAKKTSWYKFW
ncbi:MAG: hypothetical protein UV82_C0010G0040 [Candidatus Magasanikbacteria bacterium GW2011_GWD2_43_18]|uniref:Uncharacterized protein n=1 Tax=Candidatus Magasanikbacteria bacterium GW2011_GWE2_42_7 TaxID=1619052 RepID=A0A0G1DLU0_9BACT|nr:MAG: hypothetical protein UV18_C0005G0143 [Candidatus Magasanikbacteria bacterium GW2011_GWC2_42_27]KKS71806.1 MAG: hypothetical protein UV42_C0019G0030 [Candidatus Magasanikbacteria bacterium GW2011_GWE2_42_7]KKT04224.1 MAG: hypothetical protein UV82_C0010G0040 [Candidatus Magasanikbacteria bacterium GW2011_GWD2_43_18]KKT25918.1 MAG: hypothetical protein UW10_C0003G0079 [Candidatus Magasanikbacteria bacterium GW2011_GWA2_43_9]HBB37894.1 hypothetical protein [Candidatus Magasanikbacteria bac